MPHVRGNTIYLPVFRAGHNLMAVEGMHHQSLSSCVYPVSCIAGEGTPAFSGRRVGRRKGEGRDEGGGGRWKGLVIEVLTTQVYSVPEMHRRSFLYEVKTRLYNKNRWNGGTGHRLLEKQEDITTYYVSGSVYCSGRLLGLVWRRGGGGSMVAKHSACIIYICLVYAFYLQLPNISRLNFYVGGSEI